MNAAARSVPRSFRTAKRKRLQAEVRKHVEAGSALYTDALLSYEGLAGDYAHQVVDHAVQYVDGKIHTNGLENFWSLLKRGINGTYVSVEPFHLFRYLDEQTFRYNYRKEWTTMTASNWRSRRSPASGSHTNISPAKDREPDTAII